MSHEPTNELDPPDGIDGAEQAVEVLRVWVADGALHVTFEPGTFEHDVAEWGRLLSDVAVHVANAVSLDGQMTYQEALRTVHDAYDKGVSEKNPGLIGRIRGRPSH